ncbi:hypothetical protein B0H14DRAFT_2381278, partial [Mycena olivaceomarginata]
HHACCTNPMGTDDDPNTVLDENFKVPGVENLCVGDISSWPNVPRWFVTTPTYMAQYNSPCSELCLNIPQISEKVTDVFTTHKL